MIRHLHLLTIFGNRLVLCLMSAVVGILIGLGISILRRRIGKGEERSDQKTQPEAQQKMLVEIRDAINQVREQTNGKEQTDEVEGPPSLSQITRDTQALLQEELRPMKETLSALTQSLANIPQSTRYEIRRCLEEADHRRKEEEARKQLEAKRLRERELMQARANIEADLTKQFDSLKAQSGVFQICQLTYEIIRTLKNVSMNYSGLEKIFLPYLEVVNQAGRISMRLKGFSDVAHDHVAATMHEIEREIAALQQSIANVEKDYRPISFVSLLGEADHTPQTQVQAGALRDLLGLEEIVVVPGSQPKSLEEFEVVTTEGMGSRTVISEVIDKGYKQRGTGVLVCKPKIKVRLES